MIRRCNRNTCRNHIRVSTTRRRWFSIGLESSVGIQFHHSAHPCCVRFCRDNVDSEFDLDLSLRLSTGRLTAERSNVCQSIVIVVVVLVRTEDLLERLFDSRSHEKTLLRSDRVTHPVIALLFESHKAQQRLAVSL